MGLVDRIRVLLDGPGRDRTTGTTGATRTTRRSPGWDGTTGRPRSSNGASSMHLGFLDWAAPGRVVQSVSATLEIAVAPAVDALYFWALQVGFADRSGHRHGAAHLGLQWYGAHPGSTAVNWGGYAEAGGELGGTTSALPSATGNPNTRDFRWAPGRRYRLTIGPGATAGSWLGSVTDLADETTTEVRELRSDGEHLVDPVVWSEVFADCDAPSVMVRWSDLMVAFDDGSERCITRVRTSYQAVADGGCANTTSHLDGGAFAQVTATGRITPPGAVLEQPGRSGGSGRYGRR